MEAFRGGGRAGGGGGDAFVLRLAMDGSAILGATYLGGSVRDIASALAVDPAGNVVVVGTTESTDFPPVNAAQPALGGVVDGTAS
jgi:hypothetical protein